MKKADVDIHLLYNLAVKLKNQPKNAVGCWMLRAEVYTDGLDVL